MWCEGHTGDSHLYLRAARNLLSYTVYNTSYRARRYSSYVYYYYYIINAHYIVRENAHYIRTVSCGPL